MKISRRQYRDNHCILLIHLGKYRFFARMSLQALSVSHTVFDPTWLDPVAGSRVDSARGVTQVQVGSNTRVLRASSEPGRVKYTFCGYARLGLSPHTTVHVSIAAYTGEKSSRRACALREYLGSVFQICCTRPPGRTLQSSFI